MEDLREVVAGILLANQRGAERRMKGLADKIACHKHDEICRIFCIRDFYRRRYLKAEQQALLWARYASIIRNGSIVEVSAALDMIEPQLKPGWTQYLPLNSSTSGFDMISRAIDQNDYVHIMQLRDLLHAEAS